MMSSTFTGLSGVRDRFRCYDFFKIVVFAVDRGFCGHHMKFVTSISTGVPEISCETSNHPIV